MIYRGKVINNQDPEKMFRVQLQIVGIDKSESDAVLWAEVAGSNDFGLSDGVGVSSVLRVGTWVWVQFEDEDSRNFQKPVVTGVVHDPTDTNQYIKDEYDDVQTFTTKCGHEIVIGDRDGNQRIYIKHCSGTDVMIDDSGNVIIHGVKDFKSDIDGNYDLTVKGNMTINCNGTISSKSDSETNFKASKINLN